MILNVVLGVTCLVVIYAEEAPQITTKQGKLRGRYQENSVGKIFSAFTAVPYAKPPLGELRFEPPAPAEPWEGILDATKPHSICPQANLFQLNTTVDGNEDCLYLNVYLPQLPNGENDLLPVMFYIHGGGWFAGHANMYVPDLLMSKDIVLVTSNYRLGPLGFLTTGSIHSLGNFGLKDQVLALKWTKENIASFGGDPNSITVFGQSAGGVSAHYHMLSPLSRGLIKGVIAQSGTALSSWALMPHFLNTRRSTILAGNLGCPTYNKDEMMSCLRAADAHDIIKQVAFFLEWDTEPMCAFKPVLEPNTPGAFLSEDPIDTIISGKAANVPLMVGLTSEEGAIKAARLYEYPELFKDLDKKFADVAPLLLAYGDSITQKHIKTVPPKIRKFYFGDNPIKKSTISQFINMVGDALVLEGTDAATQLHAKFSEKPVYYYLFGYNGSVTHSGNTFKNFVGHYDDLLYLFKSNLHIPDYQPTAADRKVADFVTTLWSNFAKYGDPTPDTDEAIAVKWKPMQRDQSNYYHIKSDENSRLAVDLYGPRAEFWRNLDINVRSARIRDEL